MQVTCDLLATNLQLVQYVCTESVELKLYNERHIEWRFVAVEFACAWEVCIVHVLLDGVCYVVACVGLLSASLPKLFDVVCRLCAGDVTMTDE